MKQGKREIVWRDRPFSEMAKGFLVAFIFLVVFVYIFITTKDTSGKVSSGLLIIFALLLFITLLTRKFSYISNYGIRMGNITFNNKKLFGKKTISFQWDKIEKIKITGKMEFTYITYFPFDYLILKPRGEKRNYDCRINDPKRFIEVIKKLGKDNLLDKNSKYLSRLNGKQGERK